MVVIMISMGMQMVILTRGLSVPVHRHKSTDNGCDMTFMVTIVIQSCDLVSMKQSRNFIGKKCSLVYFRYDHIYFGNEL